jgi:ABC-2 type transport system permease protein
VGARLKRIGAVARVEGLQIARDRASLVLIFLLPIFQILLYGYAINLEPRQVALAMATDEPRLTDQAMDAIQSTPILRLLKPVGPSGSAERAVRDGRAQVGVEVGRDPETRAVAVRIIADSGDPAEVRPAVAVLQTGLWRRVAEVYAQDQTPVVSTEWLRNPGDANAWTVAPGLIGMIVMVTMLFLGSLTLVRERERGSWETLLATPVRPSEALLGKLAPYLVIGLMQTVMLLAIVHVLFHVPLPPATLALVAATPLFVGAYLILGFAISAVAHTQIQSVQAAVFCYLPSLMLSGFMFPFNGMPRWAQLVGDALPLTHYIRATRNVLLRGATAGSVWPEMLPVAVFGAVAAVVAIACYRRRLD